MFSLRFTTPIIIEARWPTLGSESLFSPHPPQSWDIYILPKLFIPNHSSQVSAQPASLDGYHHNQPLSSHLKACITLSLSSGNRIKYNRTSNVPWQRNNRACQLQRNKANRMAQSSSYCYVTLQKCEPRIKNIISLRSGTLSRYE
jgi:hypothetical protein